MNLYKILEFDRNDIYTHFCFSEILILREKKVSRIFFTIEYKTIIKKLQKILKKIKFRKVAQKGTILHQMPLITPFF